MIHFDHKTIAFKVVFLILMLLYTSPSWAQWNQYPTIPSSDFYCIKAYNSTFLYASTQDYFFKSTDAGTTWVSYPIVNQFGTPILGTVFYDIQFVSTSTGFAVGFTSIGNEEIIFKTTNGGSSWTLTTPYTGGSWPRVQYGVHFVDTQTGYVVGTNGRIRKTQNTGGSWTTLTTGTTNNLYDVFFPSYSTGFVVGENRILKTTSGGSSWNTTSISGDFKAVYFPSSATGYAGGDNNLFYKTINGGVSWSQITLNIPGNFNITSMFFTNDNTGYISAGNTIYKTVDGGLYWEKFLANDLIRSLFFVSSNIGLAAGSSGQLLYTNTAGSPALPIAHFNYSPSVLCNDSIIPFNNLSNSNYTYQWLLNGLQFATTYNASLTINDPNQTDTISLVVTNGFGTDTFITSIYIQPSLDIDLQTAVLKDTVCLGQPATFYVYNSEINLIYKLRKGTSQIGSQQYGNGGTLTFTTGSIQGIDTFNIFTTKYFAGCGSYSEANYYTIYPGNADISKSIYAQPSTICINTSTQIFLPNSEPTVSYQLKKGAVNVGPTQIGNGSTLIFDTNILTSTTTFTISATTVHGCVSNLTQSAIVTIEQPEVYFSLSTFNPEIGVSIYTLNNSINPGGTYEWTFTPNATPSFSTLQNVSGLTFSVPGSATAKLVATGPMGCKDSLTKNLNVLNTVVTDSCKSINIALGNVNTSLHCVKRDHNNNSYALFLLSNGNNFNTYSGNGDSLAASFTNIPNYENKYCLVKYNFKGIPQWYTYLRSGTNNMSGGSIEIDQAGNVYIAYHHHEYLDSCRIYSADGSFLTFDPPHTGSSSNTRSIVVVKYNSMGIYQWHRTFLEDYYRTLISTSLDTLGNLFIAGNYKVAKLDTNGTVLWNIYEFLYNQNIEIIADNNGGAWVLESQRGRLKHYNDSGIVVQQFPPLSPVYSPGIINSGYLRTDVHNNFYVAAVLRDTIVFNGDTIADPDYGSSYYDDIIIYKIKKDGVPVWIKQFKSKAYSYISGFDVEGNNVVLSFSTKDSLVANDTTYIMNKPALFIYKTDTLGLNSQLLKFHETTTSLNLSVLGPGWNCVDLSDNGTKIDFGFLFYEQVNAPSGLIVNTFPATGYKNFGVYSGEINCLFSPVDSNLPVPSFVVDNYCENTPIQFTDISANNPNSWYWDFPGGSPAFSTSQNPVTTYTNPGVYQVSQTVSNVFGSNTYTQNIIITQDIPTITPADTLLICFTSPVNLLANSGYYHDYQWKKNGVDILGETNQRLFLYNGTFTNHNGIYTVSVTTSCDTSISDPVNVIISTSNPYYPGLISGPQKVCKKSVHTYSVLPSNATSFNWTIPASAQIISGAGTNSIQVKFENNAGVISVAAINGCGISQPSSVGVQVKNCILQDKSPFHSPLRQASANFDFAIFPNPANSVLNIHFVTDSEQEIKIKCYDAFSRVVINETMFSVIDLNEKQIDVSPLSCGVYLVEIIVNDQILRQKIIVER